MNALLSLAVIVVLCGSAMSIQSYRNVGINRFCRDQSYKNCPRLNCYQGQRYSYNIYRNCICRCNRIGNTGMFGGSLGGVVGTGVVGTGVIGTGVFGTGVFGTGHLGGGVVGHHGGVVGGVVGHQGGVVGGVVGHHGGVVGGVVGHHGGVVGGVVDGRFNRRVGGYW